MRMLRGQFKTSLLDDIIDVNNFLLSPDEVKKNGDLEVIKTYGDWFNRTGFVEKIKNICASGKEPDKNKFILWVRCLSNFGESLSFVNNLYSHFKPYKGFWTCDAGIPVAGMLGDDFGEKAFEYLLSSTGLEWYEIPGKVEKAQSNLVKGRLTNEEAVYYVIKLVLNAALYDHDAKELSERGKRVFCDDKGDFVAFKKYDQEILVRVFNKLKNEYEDDDSMKKRFGLITKLSESVLAPKSRIAASATVFSPKKTGAGTLIGAAKEDNSVAHPMLGNSSSDSD